MDNLTLALNYKRGQKTWVAVIGGKSRKFGLEREFVACFSCMPANRKKTSGIREYLLEEGIAYEVCELDERGFAKVVDGVITPIAKAQLLEIIEEREAQKRQTQAEIDNAIVRFNAEGGFSRN